MTADFAKVPPMVRCPLCKSYHAADVICWVCMTEETDAD